MGWKDVLKTNILTTDMLMEVENFANLVINILEKNWYETDKVSYLIRKFVNGLSPYDHDPLDMNNPQDIVRLSNKFNRYGGYNRIQMDFNDPKQVNHFLKTMKDEGYNMVSFKTKGLLTESSSGGQPIREDYTVRVKEVIKILKNMNKPITQEIIMHQLDMEEDEWDEKYDKIMREESQ